MAAYADVQPPANFGGPTPNSTFYVTSYKQTPKVDVAKWTLKIHGLVDQPLQFSYEDIKRLPSVKQMLTLECIGNPPGGKTISNAEWTGAMLPPAAGTRRRPFRCGVCRDARCGWFLHPVFRWSRSCASKTGWFT